MLVHGGAACPLPLGRSACAKRASWGEGPQRAVDKALTPHPPALRCAQRAGGADRTGPPRGYRSRDVRFSNRPIGVKRFQTTHHCSVDVARGLVLLFGIGTKALPSWDSRTRLEQSNDAVLPSSEQQVQADMRTRLIHRLARDIIPPPGGARVTSYRIGAQSSRFMGSGLRFFLTHL
jgi:hypothetical protein